MSKTLSKSTSNKTNNVLFVFWHTLWCCVYRQTGPIWIDGKLNSQHHNMSEYYHKSTEINRPMLCGIYAAWIKRDVENLYSHGTPSKYQHMAGHTVHIIRCRGNGSKVCVCARVCEELEVCCGYSVGTCFYNAEDVCDVNISTHSYFSVEHLHRFSNWPVG